MTTAAVSAVAEVAAREASEVAVFVEDSAVSGEDSAAASVAVAEEAKTASEVAEVVARPEVFEDEDAAVVDKVLPWKLTATAAPKALLQQKISFQRKTSYPVSFTNVARFRC